MDTLKTLQQNLIVVKVLALPSNEGCLTLVHSTCDNQICCVPMEDYRDRLQKTSVYWAQRLNAAEQYYDTAHCECLRVVWDILHLLTGRMSR